MLAVLFAVICGGYETNTTDPLVLSVQLVHDGGVPVWSGGLGAYAHTQE